jgi:hypothetical protein
VSRRGRRNAGTRPDQAPVPPGPREPAPDEDPGSREERRTRGKRAPGEDPDAQDERRSHEWASRLLGQAAFLAAIVVVTTLVAELAGAANLGVALGIGQIAFAVALVALLLWR